MIPWQLSTLLHICILQVSFYMSHGIIDLSPDDEDDDTNLQFTGHIAALDTPTQIQLPSVPSQQTYSNMYPDGISTKLDHYKRLTGKDTSYLDGM